MTTSGPTHYLLIRRRCHHTRPLTNLTSVVIAISSRLLDQLDQCHTQWTPIDLRLFVPLLPQDFMVMAEAHLHLLPLGGLRMVYLRPSITPTLLFPKTVAPHHPHHDNVMITIVPEEPLDLEGTDGSLEVLDHHTFHLALLFRRA